MRLFAATALVLLLVGTTVADDKTDAMQALSESRFDEAVRLYTRLVEADPKDGESTYRLAMALMSLDRLEEAATRFQDARELGYQPMGVDYRLARIYARMGRRDEALDKLEAIAAAGFPAVKLIAEEADFTGLTDDARYQAALAAIRGNRYPCQSRSESRGFDFWVGQWDVSSAGAPAGSNDVRLILGDCVVFENWQSVSGTAGKSFNYYDAGEGHWRQIWVDDTGNVIEFTGRASNGMMRYTATTHDPASGAATLHKLTFTRNDDGSVRQFWETSGDDGATWQVAFDGHYAPRERLSGTVQD